MRIDLHISMLGAGCQRIQKALAARRAQLPHKGVLYPKSAGLKHHGRLYEAVAETNEIAGSSASEQSSVWQSLRTELEREARENAPHYPVLHRPGGHLMAQV